MSAKSKASEKDFTFIDLFAGIGGMRLGFESAGGRCVLTSEIDAFAVETYSLNYSPDHPHKYFGDICKIKSADVPKHDVLIAGFPCQPYSIAGLRKGLKDERGTVFMEIIRILKDKKPKAILLENVKGILAHDNGRTFEYMVSLIEDLGYHVKHQTLNSMTHGNVPQNRERVFIVGFLSKVTLIALSFLEQYLSQSPLQMRWKIRKLKLSTITTSVMTATVKSRKALPPKTPSTNGVDNMFVRIKAMSVQLSQQIWDLVATTFHLLRSRMGFAS